MKSGNFHSSENKNNKFIAKICKIIKREGGDELRPFEEEEEEM
jgi:hypothetical protein